MNETPEQTIERLRRSKEISEQHPLKTAGMLLKGTISATKWTLNSIIRGVFLVITGTILLIIGLICRLSYFLILVIYGLIYSIFKKSTQRNKKNPKIKEYQEELWNQENHGK